MKIILASNSPRRKELLAGLGVDFEVRLKTGVAESYPSGLQAKEVAEYISREKAAAYTVAPDEVLVTADTVVIVGDEILGKPKDASDARRMLGKISGCTHQVVTGVCISTQSGRHSFSVATDVTFKCLSTEEIDFYVDNYMPLDKAGAYGIQEWIGYVGVTSIHGSYYNVMGLPIQKLYEELTSRFGLKLQNIHR